MKKELTIFDDPNNVKKLIRFFYVVLGALLGADFYLYFGHLKHGHFAWEDKPQFFAVYGFVCCVLVIFGAKLLRVFVMRKENHYDSK